MAAMRFDGMPDQIEKVLFSSLMDRTVLDPSLQNTFMGAKLDPLASDTWEEVTVGECVFKLYLCMLNGMQM